MHHRLVELFLVGISHSLLAVQVGAQADKPFERIAKGLSFFPKPSMCERRAAVKQPYSPERVEDAFSEVRMQNIA
jgi:hypothetical protein